MYQSKNPLRLVFALIGISYTIKAATIHRQLNQTSHQQMIKFGSFQFWLFALLSFGLSLFAGLCSGLTVGYMAISKSQMELWVASGDQNKKKVANVILNILNNHHFLLSTLLLSNALALQALPIFLDRIVPAYAAIFISTAAVVIFGQVIPQAYCTGQHKTSIGYFFSPFITFLQFILYPFVKPIVVILDHFIEHDEGKLILTMQKIKSLLFLHNKKQYGYRPEQIQMLQNCLDLRYMNINQAMTPLQKAYMLQTDTKINLSLLQQIQKNNYAKIPIYQKTKDKIIGFIKLKNLLSIDINNPVSFRQSKIIDQPIFININTTLLDAIDILKNQKSNFAVIVAENMKCIGIVMLQQIFDKIVLKKFNDRDIRVNIHLNTQVRMDQVMESKEQD